LTVYRVISTSGGVACALKITANTRRVADEDLKRLKLPDDSDYIVRTLNFYRVSSKVILQMQLCRHDDISQNHFDEITVWKLVHDVGNGLYQIHQLGWMHLDMSPSNILRHDQIFKLAGFGTLTKIGQFVKGNEGAGPYVSLEALAFSYGRNSVSLKLFRSTRDCVDGYERVLRFIDNSSKMLFGYIKKHQKLLVLSENAHVNFCLK
jgi:serine/threonine protein kinase